MMRRIISLAGTILALQIAAAAAQEEYRLEAGDVIEIWTAQEPGLRREIAVGPDGLVSLPLAGHLQARGLSVPELETALHDRLKSYFKDTLDLTVMLQPNPQHRPTVFVAGDVENPGAYPFRSGMTVLHSVSVAGGLFRGALRVADQDRALVVRSEIERLEVRLKQLDAQIARLNAELEGKTHIAAEKDIAANSFIEQEQKVLDNRLAEFAIQDSARLQIVNLNKSTAEALRKQYETLTKRIDLTKRRLDSISKLVAKGYANTSVELELQSDVAELQGTQNELEADMAAAESALVTEKARFETVEQQRRTSLVVELREAQREQQAVRESLADSMNIMSVYTATAPSQSGEKRRVVSYSIVRVVNGQPAELEASEMQTIQSGDLIRVRYADSESSRDATASVPAGGAPALQSATAGAITNSN